MQFVEHTPYRLTLAFVAERHLALRKAIALTVMTGIATTTLLFGETHRLTCLPAVPPMATCTLAASSLARGTRTLVAIADLNGATVEYRRGGRKQHHYQVMLSAVSGQRHWLAPRARRRESAQRDAAQINNYLANSPTSTLTIVSKKGFLGWLALLGGIPLLGGVAIANLTHLAVCGCTVDVRTKRLTLDRRSWVGQRSQTTYPLGQIKAVQVVDRKRSKGKTSCTTQILLETGKSLDLIGSEPCDDQQRVAKAINQLLDR